MALCPGRFYSFTLAFRAQSVRFRPWLHWIHLRGLQGVSTRSMASVSPQVHLPACFTHTSITHSPTSHWIVRTMVGHLSRARCHSHATRCINKVVGLVRKSRAVAQNWFACMTMHPLFHPDGFVTFVRCHLVPIFSGIVKSRGPYPRFALPPSHQAIPCRHFAAKALIALCLRI
ncbi:hypothetical protein BCR44DRAFT_1442383 [Catenaria anguillulae PL171]|uniref:Uncharacterized protein n=1 Tax=Catenaria anguillulae PL171 TaxID=765915 RepID=A0A1Y2HA61_9FUNG|nr:hypothetical protein BCR44DRAFT_1442383 [Catenaria anguillulae PL171]